MTRRLLFVALNCQALKRRLVDPVLEAKGCHLFVSSNVYSPEVSTQYWSL
jgi:hypothetical protein